MAVTASPGATRPRKVVVYPSSDGKPMAETDQHRNLTVYVIEALKARYADRPDVYVSGDNFIFYQEGDPRKRVSPDAYVVFGVPMRERDSYKAWEEGGRLPDVVFEFTSRKTRHEDTHKKPLLAPGRKQNSRGSGPNSIPCAARATDAAAASTCRR
jgi:hypothetical protein